MRLFRSRLPLSAVLLSLFFGSFSSWAWAAVPPTPPSSTENLAEASSAFQFAIGKSLAAEGLVTPALEAIIAAERLAPNDPYIKIERAQLELQQPSASRSQQGASLAVSKAIDAVESAQRLAPDNVEILRAAGQIYTQLGFRNPQMLPRARDLLTEVRKRLPDDLQTLLPLGQILMELGDARGAVAVYTDLARVAPSKRMAADLLSEAMIKAEDGAGAETVLRSLLTVDPEALELRLRLSDLIQDRGDVAALVELLAAAPESARDDVNYLRRYATALYLSGDLEGSLAVIDSAKPVASNASPTNPLRGNPKEGANPEDSYLVRLRGLLFAAEGRDRESVELLTRVLDESPNDVGVGLALARALDRLGRGDESEKRLVKLADELSRQGEAEGAAEVRFELADLLVEGKEWLRAAAAVEPLRTATDPAVREQAILITASAFADAGRGAEAIELLDQAGQAGTASSPASPAVLAKRAEVLAKLGRESEAKEGFEKLAEASTEATLAVSQAYLRMERYRDAIPLLETVVGAKADFAPAFFLLGSARERLGEHAEAVVAFRRALEIAPNFHAALNYLGYLWADRGENLDEALKLIRRAVTLDPENGAYVDSLGWAHYQLKQYDRAQIYLERATRLLPRDPVAFEHLGDLYRTLGDVAKAREQYRRAIELAGENVDAVKKKLDALPRR